MPLDWGEEVKCVVIISPLIPLPSPADETAGGDSLDPTTSSSSSAVDSKSLVTELNMQLIQTHTSLTYV